MYSQSLVVLVGREEERWREVREERRWRRVRVSLENILIKQTQLTQTQKGWNCVTTHRNEGIVSHCIQSTYSHLVYRCLESCIMFRFRHLLKFPLTTQQLKPTECYYKTLDIPPSSDINAIRQAYLDSVKKYHPDLSKTDSTAETFTLVQKAYEVLSDAHAKTEYDRAQGYTVTSKGQKSPLMDLEEAERAMERVREEFQRGEKNRKKDLLNDEYNFSYKMLKAHFDKIESKKPEYQKFFDDGGQYYEKKDYKNPSLLKSFAFVLMPLGLGLGGYWLLRG